MRVTVREISQRLSENAERVATMLLPNGKIHGGVLEVGGVNGHTGKSLKVNLEGARVGRWKDWADVEGGDLLDLWAATKSISLPLAIQEAKAWLGIREEPLREKRYTKPPVTHPALEAQGRAMQWLVMQRMIPAAVVNRFKVAGNSSKGAIVFPSFTPSGELVNHSYRTLAGEKRVWQDEKCAPCLWGWHGISSTVWEKREILICEGQIDAMSWAVWGIDAVSIPNGGGRTWIDYEWNNLEAFQTIFLSFDMDGKSDENLRETIARLGKHRCRVVKLPAKDANDALKAGRSADEARAWLEAAEYVPMPHLARADKFTGAVEERFFPSGEAPDGYALEITTHKAKRKTFRFRNGEATLWTGTTGHGKSTLINASVLILAAACHSPSLIISLETAPPEIIYRQIKAANMPVQNNADVPRAVEMIANYVLFYDRIGHIQEDELFEVMTYAHARHGVRHIVIDSLMRIDGMEEDYPRQTAFIIRAVTFARETGCHVHVVAHPRKSAGHEVPESYDVAGSGNLRNNADNVLALWRNLEKERKSEDGEDVGGMPDAVLHVHKDRIQGDTRKFALSYDAENFRYRPFVPEPGSSKPTNQGHPNARRR